jgi:hypothetical protein
MRDFFRQILNDLYIYCGNRQVDKMTDTEITTLLDALCYISRLFDYIPEEEQQRIIRQCLMSDKEYQNLNARLINKWLSDNGKMFFREAAHKENEQPEDYKPLSIEEAQPYIDQFKANLEKIGKQERKQVEVHESSALKKYYEGKQKFVIDGVEVIAESEERAREIYLMNFDK